MLPSNTEFITRNLAKLKISGALFLLMTSHTQAHLNKALMRQMLKCQDDFFFFSTMTSNSNSAADIIRTSLRFAIGNPHPSLMALLQAIITIKEKHASTHILYYTPCMSK